MVVSYDWQVRKAVGALLNSGMNYASALAQVKKDDRHFQLHFLNHVAMSRDHSVSAPGLRALSTNPVVARPIRDQGAGTTTVPKVKDTKSKNARARANKKQALADARASSQVQPRGQQRAILDRSNGGGGKGGGGGGGGKGKSKGKGKIDTRRRPVDLRRRAEDLQVLQHARRPLSQPLQLRAHLLDLRQLVPRRPEPRVSSRRGSGFGHPDS